MTDHRSKLRRHVAVAAATARRRASIYIVAMWVVLVLGGLVLVFGRSMRVEAIASGNRLSAVQCASIERGAEQFVLAQVDGTAGDAVSITGIAGQAIPVGDGYFWLLRANPADDKNYDFGIIDECSKLNINTAPDDQLVNLPNVTQDIADSIVDWRDSDENVTGQGAESSYYQGLPEPYNCKNANFETVEELLLIKGPGGQQNLGKDVLYGYDLNHDGVIDAGEQAASGGAGGMAVQYNGGGGSTDTRGLFNFVTCYTIEPNTDANGNKRININDPASRTALGNLLATSLSQSRVAQVMSSVAGTGSRRRFSSIIAWYQASGLTPQEFGPIASSLTTTANPTIPGLVNVNTAPRQVLLCLPGVQSGDADSIVSSRVGNSGGVTGAGGSGITMGTSSNATAPSGDLTWLFQAVSPQTAASIAPYITTRSFQYSADIVAVSGDGRSFKRVRIVVDARNSPPAIVYRRDLTGLGWPLPPDLRKAMREGKPPTIIQSTGGSGLSGH